MSNFYLAYFTKNVDLTERIWPDLIFEKGSEAKAKADELMRIYDYYTIQVRRFAKEVDGTTLERAQSRVRVFPLPKEWAELTPIENHFAHLIDGNLYFYRNRLDLAIQRTTCMGPGRYITEFYPDVDPRPYVAAIHKPDKVHFAETRDEVQWVYEFGPASCMSGPACNFDSDYHPTRIYADSPDLKLAYIKKRNSEYDPDYEHDEYEDDWDYLIRTQPEVAAARCLVWPEKKVWARIYGHRHLMEASLADLGYREGKPEDFVGARIPFEGVCPYIDDVPYAKPDGKYLVLMTRPDKGDDIYLCCNTAGFAQHGYICEKYTSWYSHDESHEDYSSAVEVHTVNGLQTWSENAFEDNGCCAFIPTTGEYEDWAADDCTFDEESCEHIPTHLYDDYVAARRADAA